MHEQYINLYHVEIYYNSLIAFRTRKNDQYGRGSRDCVYIHIVVVESRALAISGENLRRSIGKILGILSGFGQGILTGLQQVNNRWSSYSLSS